MSVEIVSIGTELLNGMGRNTNADRIIDALGDLGIPVDYITTVGDDSARLGEALRTAVHRVPIVITTGGLGPTPDDLTRKTIATVFRRRLVLDETVLALMSREQIRRSARSCHARRPSSRKSWPAFISDWS